MGMRSSGEIGLVTSKGTTAPVVLPAKDVSNDHRITQLRSCLCADSKTGRGRRLSRRGSISGKTENRHTSNVTATHQSSIRDRRGQGVI